MAIKSYKVRVSEEIIGIAKKESARHCLVAEAIRYGVPDSYSISVTSEFVRFNVGDHIAVTGTRFVYPTPARVSEQIKLFDERGQEAVAPFEFTLDGRQATSAPVIKTGERDAPYKKRKRRKTERAEHARRCVMRRYAGLLATSKA